MAQEKNKITGSGGNDPDERVDIISNAILSFKNLFGFQQGLHDFVNNKIIPVNHHEQASIATVICTSGKYHLVDKLKGKNVEFSHIETDDKPTNLGFACHQILKDNVNNFDYFCYIEDDMIIHDPYFFWKLEWFNKNVGNDYILQPLQYEISKKAIVKKLYIGATIPEHWTKKHRKFDGLNNISLHYLNREIIFCPAKNPHSGAFFLNNEQFQKWISMPYFLDGDSSFIGPMESAATLGIMKCFIPYKPCSEFANFFEIQHGDSRYINNLKLVE